MTSKITKHRMPGMPCPDCGGRATQRKGVQTTQLVREIYYRCENDGCGTGFVAQLETIRITQRSAAPRAGSTHLPFAPHLLTPKPANDDQPLAAPLPANDDADAMTG